MSMTEATEAETAKPKAKAKPKKRHARANKRDAAPPAAAKPPSILAGLNITDCATGCVETGKCVISGSVCAHPGKTGLQISLQTPETLKRFGEAKRMIGQAKLDLQNF